MEGDSIIILIGLKIIILLFAVNAAPPVIAFLLEDRWNRPIDWNRTFLDGKPLLGRHKTIRGIIGSLSAGILIGWFLGLPLIVGFCLGFFSILGDLLTSFFKRRFELANGTAVPLLDQLFERKQRGQAYTFHENKGVKPTLFTRKQRGQAYTFHSFSDLSRV